MDNSRNKNKRAMKKGDSIESKQSKAAFLNDCISSLKPQSSIKTEVRLLSDKNTLSSTSGANKQLHENSLKMEIDADENFPSNFQEMKSHPKLPLVHNNDDNDDSKDNGSDDGSEDDNDGDGDENDDDSEDNGSDDDSEDNDEDDDDENDEDENDDSDDDDGDNILGLNPPLIYKPHITAKDHFLGTVAISLQHRMSYKATLGLLEVFKMISKLDDLPTSKNALWEALSRDNSSIIEHYYCNKCRGYLGKKISGELVKQCLCGPRLSESNLRYFLEINLSSQLKQLFSIPNIYESLQYRFNRIKKQADALEDIYDGAEYRRLCLNGNFLSDRNNFTFTFNTGARKVVDSSNINAWPIYVEINELPPHMRKKCMLLAGIYVDNKPPIMSHFLLPFMTEMKKLYDHGIVWKTSEGVEITSKFIAVICSVNSVTRASILQMNQYDKDYGCINCYASGHNFSREKYIYPIAQSYGRLRTHNEVVNDMLQAYNTKITINGMKGISPLTGLPLFDICKDVVVESMDAIFLGVVKQHIKIMMKTSNTPYYIGSDNNCSLIDNTLLNIILPSCCSTPPRNMSKWNRWKAFEWKNWLGYAPAYLQGVIHVKYTKHFSLLSEAIEILNSDHITQQRLNHADDLLKEYIQLFEQYFGIQNMSYNIHLLTHITDIVRNWGPIWSYSGFIFESWNNKIINTVKRPHKRIDEIVTHFLMHKYFTCTFSDSSVAIETKNFIRGIMKIPNIENGNQQNIVGESIERAPTNTERLLLLKENYQPQIISCYNEIKINGVEFQSQSTGEIKFCNSIIADEMGNYGTIVNIVSFQHENQRVFKIFMQQFRHIKYAFDTQYISKVKLTDNIVCISKIKNITPAIKISTPTNTYIYKLSNFWETD